MWVHHPSSDQPNAKQCEWCEARVTAGRQKPNPHTDPSLGDPHVQVVENTGDELVCWCGDTVHMHGCDDDDSDCYCVTFFEQTGSVVAAAR